MTYTTGLTASKALKEAGIEVETEKYWVYNRHGEWNCFNEMEISEFCCAGDEIIPSPSLSELVEVFKLLGEKNGWGKDGEYSKWMNEYEWLCHLWATTQSQERCDEYVIDLIKQ